MEAWMIPVGTIVFLILVSFIFGPRREQPVPRVTINPARESVLRGIPHKPPVSEPIRPDPSLAIRNQRRRAQLARHNGLEGPIGKGHRAAARARN